MAAILISHCERNLGSVEKPVGTGDPSCFVCLFQQTKLQLQCLCQCRQCDQSYSCSNSVGRFYINHFLRWFIYGLYNVLKYFQLQCISPPPHTFLRDFQGLFTWSGGPRSSGVGFFCFHALEDTKQKKPTPLDRGPPLHVNRVLIITGYNNP